MRQAKGGFAVTADSLLEEGAGGVKQPGALRVGFASVTSDAAYPGTPQGAYGKDVSPDMPTFSAGNGMPDAAQLQVGKLWRGSKAASWVGGRGACTCWWQRACLHLCMSPHVSLAGDLCMPCRARQGGTYKAPLPCPALGT